jgi:hypothetical protein
MQRAGDQTAVTDSKTGGENTTTTVCLCESTLHIQANSLQEPFAFDKQTGYMDVDEGRACSAFATDSSGLISNLDLLSPGIPTETILSCYYFPSRRLHTHAQSGDWCDSAIRRISRKLAGLRLHFGFREAASPMLPFDYELPLAGVHWDCNSDEGVRRLCRRQ